MHCKAHITSCNAQACFTMFYNALHCFTMPYNTLQCFTILYNALQCFTILYNTLQLQSAFYTTKSGFKTGELPESGIPPSKAFLLRKTNDKRIRKKSGFKQWIRKEFKQVREDWVTFCGI